MMKGAIKVLQIMMSEVKNHVLQSPGEVELETMLLSGLANNSKCFQFIYKHWVAARCSV